MESVITLSAQTGVRAACDSLGVARATFYRLRSRGQVPPEPAPARPSPARAMAPEERERVLQVLHSERFQDCAPAAIHAQLLDEGQYLCSTRTMYRLLAQREESGKRGSQLVHPPYHKPELLATGPNQVWSWDITKLRGPVKWTYFYLYVVIDIFSRYVTGWLVADRECAELAKQLLDQTIANHQVQPGQLTIHSDRGKVMRSKSLALLYADLGVAKSFSRPYVSDDNPFSESQFRTLKYHPGFPGRFASLLDSRAYCQTFFPWYNEHHHHSGLAMLTPYTVHFGQTDTVLEQRQRVLDDAYRLHPERFVHRPPSAKHPPNESGINLPHSTSSQNPRQ